MGSRHRSELGGGEVMRGRPLVPCRGTDQLPDLPLWLRVGDTCPLCLVLRDPSLRDTTRQQIVKQAREALERDELQEWKG